MLGVKLSLSDMRHCATFPLGTDKLRNGTPSLELAVHGTVARTLAQEGAKAERKIDHRLITAPCTWAEDFYGCVTY